MSRYFLTTNASLTYNAGGVGFPFEPVCQRGGTWLGVLAVEEDSAANILLAAGFPQVAEISGERFNLEKKKVAPRATGSLASPTRQSSIPGVAGRAGQSSARGAAKGVDPARDPNSTAGITGVSLLGTVVLTATSDLPPHEPLLEQAAGRRIPAFKK